MGAENSKDCLVILSLTSRPNFTVSEMMSVLHYQRNADFRIVILKHRERKFNPPPGTEEVVEKVLTVEDETLTGRILNSLVDSMKSRMFVFLTDRAMPTHDHWLNRIIKPIAKDGAAAAFGREVSTPGGNYFVIEDMHRRFPIAEDSDKGFFSIDNCAISRDELLKCRFSQSRIHDPASVWITESGLNPTYQPEAIVMRPTGITLKEVYNQSGLNGSDHAVCGIRSGLVSTLSKIALDIIGDIGFCFSLRKPQYIWYPFLYRTAMHLGYYSGWRKGRATIAVSKVEAKNEKN